MERASESEKPAINADDVKFPPLPDPTDDDFDEDVSEEEKAHYKSKFPDLNQIVSMRLHCTACDRHLGCSALNDTRMKIHPMLRTLICNTCHSFYNSGEFDKGEDGSELYCRWCGQGGQVYCCSDCIHVFCAKCIKRNLGLPKIKEIENTDDWKCFKCNSKCIWDLRAVCWALIRYCDLRNKLVRDTDDTTLQQAYSKAIAIDISECCKNKGRKSIKSESAKKKEKEKEKEKEKDKDKEKIKEPDNVTKNIISKMPPTIQVKKFASVNLDDFKPKLEKKPQKRPASPKNKAVMIKNPIAIAPCASASVAQPMIKKFRDNSSQNIIEVNMENTWTENLIPRKKMGRPFGSKNKNTTSVTQLISQTPKKRGRPCGSKNKKRDKLRRPLTSNHGTGKIKRRGRPIGSKTRSLVEHQNVDTEQPLILKPSGTWDVDDNQLQHDLELYKSLCLNKQPKKRGTNNCRGRPKTSEADSSHKENKHGPRTHEERKNMLEVEIEGSVPNLYAPMRFGQERKIVNLTRVPRPRIINNTYNGFPNPGLYNPMNVNNINMNMNMNNFSTDNINLSLDNLTQGLDFAAVQAMRNSTNSSYTNNDSLLCTPDFPLEPLCEVTEDNDDDVECITPGPVGAPMHSNPPPLAPVRNNASINLPKGVIQMTDSDVTVNAATGGLKFRVDPQTLSSNKMYRLPDGRIFAINANPNMPGGYSATIVSQNPDGSPKVTPRSETFAAKLSTITSSPKGARGRSNTPKSKSLPKSKPKKSKPSKDVFRESDLKVPVEWFRYNVIDSVDALEYSLARLQKLKKDTPATHLRTRTVEEMKYLHRTLEQLLTTSSKRFLEIRDTLNKEMKLYLSKKGNKQDSAEEEEEDDDVEILPNHEDTPIFIDENSLDSVNDNESHNIDLTEAASSEHNDSAENRNNVGALLNEIENMNEDSTNSTVLGSVVPDAEKSTEIDNADVMQNDTSAKKQLLENDIDKMETDEPANTSANSFEVISGSDKNVTALNGNDDNVVGDDDNVDGDTDDEKNEKKNEEDLIETSEDATEQKENKQNGHDKTNDENKQQTDNENKQQTDEEENTGDGAADDKGLTSETPDQDGENPEADMSEEMIETLLKDDNSDQNASMEISDLQEAESILS